MTDFEIAILASGSWLSGILSGYIFWAQDTNFKRGLVEGLSLRFIWWRFFK